MASIYANRLKYETFVKPETDLVLLIQKGIDINQATKRGYTALHLASNHGNKEMVRFSM